VKGPGKDQSQLASAVPMTWDGNAAWKAQHPRLRFGIGNLDRNVIRARAQTPPFELIKISAYIASKRLGEHGRAV